MCKTSVQKYATGYSLLEVLVVVSLLGLLAIVVIPNMAATDEKRLELAVSEVVSAIRYARSQALRGKDDFGVEVDVSMQRIRLYWVDDSGATPVRTFDVLHPVDKKNYQLLFSTSQMPAQINTANFKYIGLAPTQPYLTFAKHSAHPKLNDSGVNRLLESAQIQISYIDHSRIITIEPTTGRVSVQ